MQSISDKVFIIPDDYEKSDFKKKNGLFLVKAYNPYDKDLVCQSGIVYSAPETLQNGEKSELKKGDKVYTTHFLNHEDAHTKAEGSYLRMLDYYECYAKKAGRYLKCLSHWNLIKPIEEEDITTKSGIIIKPSKGMVHLTGTVKFISDQLQQYGVKEGDTIYFKTDREYEINIGEEVLYRIRTKDIIGVEC